MIIWTRWGLLVVLGLLLGGVLGSTTLDLLGISVKGPQMLAMMLWYGAAVNLALALWVFPRLDKPRTVMLTRPVASPVPDERGRMKTSESVPVRDPEGNPIVQPPTSTLFFIPARFYWIILAVVALLPTAEWIFRR